jgi:hypothetical protein
MVKVLVVVRGGPLGVGEVTGTVFGQAVAAGVPVSVCFGCERSGAGISPVRGALGAL